MGICRPDSPCLLPGKSLVSLEWVIWTLNVSGGFALCWWSDWYWVHIIYYEFCSEFIILSHSSSILHIELATETVSNFCVLLLQNQACVTGNVVSVKFSSVLKFWGTAEILEKVTRSAIFLCTCIFQNHSRAKQSFKIRSELELVILIWFDLIWCLITFFLFGCTVWLLLCY